MKRATDIAVGGLLALAAVPVIVVCALILAVLLRASPFFVQERVGLAGRTFRLIKLRTLPRSTPPYADKYGIAGVAVPRFARVLRRMHVDELPQLFLVPVGRMSLVGPRPEMPALHAKLPARFADLRTSVRPGCTGLWQIGPDSAGLIGETPHYDEFYVHHRSARLDIWILIETAKLMIGRGRQFRISEVPGHLVWRGTLPPERAVSREGLTRALSDIHADRPGRIALVDEERETLLHQPHLEEVSALLQWPAQNVHRGYSHGRAN